MARAGVWESLRVAGVGVRVQPMTDVEKAELKAYVERWKRVGPLLEEQREEDVRRSDTIGAFAFFAGMPHRNLETFPPGPSSGLVEQQRWFRKIASKSTN